MAEMTTLEDVHAAMSELDIRPEDETTALVLLSSLVVGANVQRIAAFTGLPKREIAKRGHFLRKSRVWRGPKLDVDWFHETDGATAFYLDMAVADGLMERKDSR